VKSFTSIVKKIFSFDKQRLFDIIISGIVHYAGEEG